MTAGRRAGRSRLTDPSIRVVGVAAALAALLAGCSAPAADQPAADYPCTVTQFDGAAAPAPVRPEHPTVDERAAMRADAPIPCQDGAP